MFQCIYVIYPISVSIQQTFNGIKMFKSRQIHLLLHANIVIFTYYYRRPYMYKFIESFTTNNIITLKKLFLIKSFERRNAVVNNQTQCCFLFVLTCTCMLLFFQLIAVLCMCMYDLCPCACVAYDLIKVMLLLLLLLLLLKLLYQMTTHVIPCLSVIHLNVHSI